MKKILIFFVLGITVTSSSLAQRSNLLQEWEKFKKEFGEKCFVVWDKQTGSLNRIIGSNIYLDSRNINKENVSIVCEAFINRYYDLFNIAGSIGQVVDSGITAWFSPGIGAIKILTSNVETEFQLVKFYLR